MVIIMVIIMLMDTVAMVIMEVVVGTVLAYAIGLKRLLSKRVFLTGYFFRPIFQRFGLRALIGFIFGL